METLINSTHYRASASGARSTGPLTPPLKLYVYAITMGCPMEKKKRCGGEHVRAINTDTDPHYDGFWKRYMHACMHTTKIRRSQRAIPPPPPPPIRAVCPETGFSYTARVHGMAWRRDMAISPRTRTHSKYQILRLLLALFLNLFISSPLISSYHQLYITTHHTSHIFNRLLFSLLSRYLPITLFQTSARAFSG